MQSSRKLLDQWANQIENFQFEIEPAH
jgi:hypothetical protein